MCHSRNADKYRAKYLAGIGINPIDPLPPPPSNAVQHNYGSQLYHDDSYIYPTMGDATVPGSVVIDALMTPSGITPVAPNNTSDSPSIMIGGKIYLLEDFDDVDLYAKKPVNVYSDSALTEVVKTVQPGQDIGKVYSWTNNATTGDLLIQLYGDPTDSTSYYFLDPAQLQSLNTDAAKQQGVKTEDQKAADEADKNKTFMDHLEDGLKDFGKDTGKTLLIIGGAWLAVKYVLPEVFTAFNNNRSRNTTKSLDAVKPI